MAFRFVQNVTNGLGLPSPLGGRRSVLAAGSDAEALVAAQLLGRASVEMGVDDGGEGAGRQLQGQGPGEVHGVLSKEGTGDSGGGDTAGGARKLSASQSSSSRSSSSSSYRRTPSSRTKSTRQTTVHRTGAVSYKCARRHKTPAHLPLQHSAAPLDAPASLAHAADTARTSSCGISPEPVPSSVPLHRYNCPESREAASYNWGVWQMQRVRGSVPCWYPIDPSYPMGTPAILSMEPSPTDYTCQVGAGAGAMVHAAGLKKSATQHLLTTCRLQSQKRSSS